MIFGVIEEAVPKKTTKRQKNEIMDHYIISLFNFLNKFYYKLRLDKIGFIRIKKEKLSKSFNIGRLIAYRISFPIWSRLEIDIHSYCNRDCEWCPRYYDRSGVRKDSTGKKIRKNMPTDKVYNIIDQASVLGYKGIVRLHRLSDGLLDSRYIKFAEYIKDKGMELFDDTNGDVLRNDPELCSKLDGLVYGFRIGLYDCRDEYSKQKEMEYWQQKFKKSLVCFSLPQEKCFLRQNTKYCYNLKYKKLLNEPCFQPCTFFQIRYDGGISLCCEDDQCNFKLGNAFRQSLEKIWWSRKHIRIAKTLSKPGGRYRFKLCSKCAMVLTTLNSKK